MIVIRSNVSMFFKKQHTYTLYSSKNRRSLDGSSNRMDGKFFLKKMKVAKFIGRLFTLTIIEEK